MDASGAAGDSNPLTETSAASIRRHFDGGFSLNTVKAVLDSLERAPELIIPLALEIPVDHRRRRPSSGRWSAHEHLVHLAEVHPLFFRRLDSMLHLDRPAIKPYNPADDEPEDALLAADLEESLDRFERDRARLVGLLRTLTQQQWQREAAHPQYARYSVFIMFRHLAMHDMLHAYRIEELLLNPEWSVP